LKNIVVCCDGTGNEYSDRNTNVVKLFSVLERDPTTQVAFYDPGVGTFSAPAALTKTARFVTKVFGLAFGSGIIKNIGDAYRFIMETYEPKDKIYIFGFSRGAYTARAVAAMLHKCGLLEARNANLVPYALKMFKYEKTPALYGGFDRTFSRRCTVEFLGLWDTVSSVGWIYNPLSIQFTANNPIVQVVRHAISIDEKRCFFRQNLWGKALSHQDVKQVWFPGVHCDVGGGYPEARSGLSRVALKWMIGEALQFGLRVDTRQLKKEISEKAVEEPAAPTPGEESAERGHRSLPDWKGPINTSLKGPWWIPEYLPKVYRDPRDGFKRKLKIPMVEHRYIPERSIIHWSAIRRMKELGYNPPNMPKEYSEEPQAAPEAPAD
jgi:uncharacterized protein (DUF2235 family)